MCFKWFLKESVLAAGLDIAAKRKYINFCPSINSFSEENSNTIAYRARICHVGD